MWRKALRAFVTVAILSFGVGGYFGGDLAYRAQAAGPSGSDMVTPTMPVTPSVPTLMGDKNGTTRTYRLTASEFA